MVNSKLGVCMSTQECIITDIKNQSNYICFRACSCACHSATVSILQAKYAKTVFPHCLHVPEEVSLIPKLTFFKWMLKWPNSKASPPPPKWQQIKFINMQVGVRLVLKCLYLLYKLDEYVSYDNYYYDFECIII